MAAVITSLILPVSVFAEGQQNQQGGQHQRPTPEQMAEQLMNKFDANKDGELSQDELTKALEELRKNRPQGPGASGAQGNASAGVSQGKQGGHSQGSAGGGAQQGAGQGVQQQEPPPADKVAAHMIEKFSSDKIGLKQAELAKALEDRMAKRGQQGGQGQQGHAGQGNQGGQGGQKADGQDLNLDFPQPPL